MIMPMNDGEEGIAPITEEMLREVERVHLRFNIHNGFNRLPKGAIAAKIIGVRIDEEKNEIVLTLDGSPKQEIRQSAAKYPKQVLDKIDVLLELYFFSTIIPNTPLYGKSMIVNREAVLSMCDQIVEEGVER